MLAVMYTINKDASGVILVCLDCPHTERVNEFDDRLGSRRTLDEAAIDQQVVSLNQSSLQAARHDLLKQLLKQLRLLEPSVPENVEWCGIS
jgi:hypothetical protein